jgi:hypothetical protein
MERKDRALTLTKGKTKQNETSTSPTLRNIAAPLKPEQAYADSSGYVEASLYVSSDAAAYGAPVVHAANDDDDEFAC